MPALIHAILLALALVAAYTWLQIPALEHYSLQAVAAATLLYLIIKRAAKANFWHIAPSALSAEMPLLTFLLLLIVGSTGNLQSYIFPITYIHLFFLVMACEVPVAIAAGLGIVLFHFALSPQVAWPELSHLISLPIVMLFFLISKYQYQELRRQQTLISQDETQLDAILTEDNHLLVFTQTFLQPKLQLLTHLAQDSTVNSGAILGQLRLVSEELTKLLSRVTKTLILILGLSFLGVSPWLVTPAQADELRSDSFVITFGNFNLTSGEKSSSSYKVTDTVGQTADGPFGSYGGSTYFVGSGFQYIYQIDTFRFTISDVDIDLGSLTAGAHNTASHNLTITTRGAGGYSIYAYELHPLRHSNGSDQIADTTCDAGTCTQTTAAVWSNQSIAGFGYNMSGNDVPAAFVDSTYYKQFANNQAAEAMQVVMSSSNIASSRQSTVTYKAGISGTQVAGNYQTGVAYVAVPGY